MYQLLFSFLLFFPAALWANNDCNILLGGEVKDADSGELLAGATIVLPLHQEETVTDENGRFLLKNLCKGTYQLQIRFLGYRNIDTTINLSANTHLQIKLSAQSFDFEKVIEVNASRSAARSSQTQRTLGGKDLERIRGKSLAESLSEVSGVTMLQTGATIAKPIIHGLHSNRVLILNNGIRQEGQQWGSEHAPEIDPFIASNLTVVKGASAVQYGADAIAGVVLVQPAALRTNSGFGGEINTVAVWNGRMGILSAIVEQGNAFVKGLAWRLQGTVKRSGDVRSPRYFLLNTGTAEYNFSATIGYQKRRHQTELFYSQFNSRIAIFKGSHIGNLTDLNNAIDADTPFYATQHFSYRIQRPAQAIQHQLAKWKYIYTLNNKHNIAVTAAFQYNRRREYDAHRAYGDTSVALDKAALDINIKTYLTDIVWEHRPAEHWHGTTGASFFFQDNTNNGSQAFIPNYYSLTAGIFSIERYRREHWQLEAGLRYDYKWLEAAMYRQDTIYRPQYHFHNVSGTLGFVLTPYDFLKINANLGSAWRAPAANELFSNGVHHSAASFEVGDEHLRPEKAYNSIVSLDLHFPKRFSAEFTGYANYIRDFIYTQPVLPATLTIRGAFPTFRYAQTHALLAGLDARLQAFIYKKLSIESQFSMVRGYNLLQHDFLPLMPSDRLSHQLKYEHNSDSMGLCAYFISTKVNTVFRQTYISANDDYAAPPPTYTLLGLQAGMTWRTAKNEYEWSFAVDNLLNTVYRDYLDRFRYYSDAAGVSFVLRLRLRFL